MQGLVQHRHRPRLVVRPGPVHEAVLDAPREDVTGKVRAQGEDDEHVEHGEPDVEPDDQFTE